MGQVLINEWLPDPLGRDTEGEWIEIANSGKDRVDLQGWSLATDSRGKFTIKDLSVAPGGYVVFERTDTKLFLRNQDGRVYLYDARGKLFDEAGFWGTAPEGKSFSRHGKIFSFVEPTPGAPNKFSPKEDFISYSYLLNQPLNLSPTTLDFLGLMFGAAALLTLAVMLITKRDENLSKLFFRRDEEVW